MIEESQFIQLWKRQPTVNMIHKFAILSGLVLSTTCMVLQQPPLPILLGLQYEQYDEPNYNFAYEVTDHHTGDIKNQHESRRGDSVLGQYSLLQPDGVRRTVDYRANDHTGFQATVNNDGRPANGHTRPVNNENAAHHPNVPAQGYQAWPAPNVPQHQPAPTHTPVAISRTSLVQTFSHGTVRHNPHNSQHPWA